MYGINNFSNNSADAYMYGINNFSNNSTDLKEIIYDAAMHHQEGYNFFPSENSCLRLLYWVPPLISFHFHLLIK